MEHKFMKSHAKEKNERYMPKGMKNKEMGHDKMPMKMKAYETEAKEVKRMPMGAKEKGYPEKAMDYKY